VDWFYLSTGSLTYVFIGIIKMIFAIFGIFIPCLLRHLRSDGSNIIGLIIFIIFVISMTISTVAWWIADLLRISLNVFKDGNNQNLSE
jgi:putative Mn2+ efflux pump MntP